MKRWSCAMVSVGIWMCEVELYRMAKNAIQLWTDSYIALLSDPYWVVAPRRDTVVDEWQISLGYMRRR